MEVVMPILDWPATERPREKLLSKGAAALSDAELLAILLRTGTRGQNAVALARQLLTQFGSLRRLLVADIPGLCQQPGLGVAKACQLHAAVELSRRQLGEELSRGTALTNPEATSQYLQAQLSDRQREVFVCILLDTRHRVLHYEELFYGTLDAAQVHPREVVKLALSRNAAAMIIAHNHPSGVAEPSRSDEAITERLKEALALVDIRLLDHLIIGGTRSTSLAARGLL
jgi:DNA repair protein RadC